MTSTNPNNSKALKHYFISTLEGSPNYCTIKMVLELFKYSLLKIALRIPVNITLIVL